ncbi:hypothetical protein V2J09_007512 [Rumex salicifolius]
MSENKQGFLNDQLSKRTSIFGLRLWMVLGICVGAGIVLILFLISLWFTSKRNSNRSLKSGNEKKSKTLEIIPVTASKLNIPDVSREITEIRIEDHQKPNREALPDPVPESDPVEGSDQLIVVRAPIEESPSQQRKIHIEIGKDHRISYPERGTGSSSLGSGDGRSGEQAALAMVGPEVSHLGWGHWYTLRELEASTNGFADENVIGEGGYGIVYRGAFEDNSFVAVKNLLNNRGQAEREFKVEVEAIGRVRHKNLVRLLGYCAEGAHRMLVYEYVDNGNLEQWLHGDVGPVSPLTWDIRMNVIVGTAKGYVAPEYASTGMLNERSDVYSFGILLMEIISGRNPVDYSRPPGEVNLVDWLKTMVSNRNSEGVLDPKLQEKPSSRALKRVLLVALRCVDPNAQKRPKMGHVVHMLEAEEFPFRDERRGTHHGSTKERLIAMEKRLTESGDSSGYESGATNSIPRLPWRKQESEEN